MKNKEQILAFLKKGLKKIFVNNLAIKAISFIFALILWGYVLMTQDPERIKTVNDVTVVFANEYELTNRKLVVRGDVDKLLKSATAKVRIRLTQYADLDADNITATINLNGINKKGTYELPIIVDSNMGSVNSISPSKVSIEVDTLVSRNIPVDIELVGDLPVGYWMGTPEISQSDITIQGPETDVKDIVRASAIVDLTDKTTSINQSVLLKLYDSENNEIDTKILYGQLPSVSLKLEILKKKTVPIRVEDAIIGEEYIDENYEVVSAEIFGNGTAEIVGSEEKLRNIKSITIESIDVSGVTNRIFGQYDLVVPEGVRIISDPSVYTLIVVSEKNAEKEFSEIDISYKNLRSQSKVSLNNTKANIKLSGPVSLINAIKKENIKVQLDLEGLAIGTHDVKPKVLINGEEVNSDLQVVVTPETVTAVIARR